MKDTIMKDTILEKIPEDKNILQPQWTITSRENTKLNDEINDLFYLMENDFDLFQLKGISDILEWTLEEMW